MATSIRQRYKPAPLTVQVTQAERRVLYHRRMVVLRASRLGHKLRGQLSSSTALLVAAALGFVGGRLEKRQASTPDKAEGPPSNSLFGAALKLISLAMPLLRRELASAIDPVQSGLPEEAGQVRPVS